jgi:DNA-binding transcriptional LysR family regulator
MDKLRAMETFVAIVEAGSLTAAANRMGASLTSVVRALAGLESQLGARLLNRTTRRIALTDEGRDYFLRCQRILGELHEAETALCLSQSAPSGSLRLTAPINFGKLHVAPVVTGFLAAHPLMRAEMMLLDRRVDLLEEGLDVAVRIGHLADSSLVVSALGHTRRVVCASPAYLDRYGQPDTPADLLRHRCIGFTGLGAEWEFAIDGKPCRLPVPGVITTNLVDVALDACLQGLGCGSFLAYQVAAPLRDGSLRRILTAFDCPPLPVSLLYPTARLLPPRVRAFVDWAAPRLRERLKGQLP